MFAMLEQAAKLKKEAFSKLDAGRATNKKISVDCNTLIDIILAYECAAEGDVSNLEYSLKVKSEMYEKAQSLLDKISDLAEVDSEIWNLSMEYI